MTRQLKICLASVAIGLLTGGLVPPTTTGDSSAPIIDTWHPFGLEDIPRFDREQFRVAARIPWQGDADTTTTDASKAAAQWQLKGIIQGQNPKALIETGAQQYLEVAVGSMLPDGSILDGVSDSYIEIRSEGCRIPRRLYKQTTLESDAPDCPTSTENSRK